MPNWCYTSYVAVGPEEDVRKLYDLMDSLDKVDYSLIENDFGKRWLGNLITVLGGDWKSVRCRGMFDDLDISGNELRFYTESAWSDPDQTIAFIKSKFPAIEFYFVAEETGCRYFVTNDKDGLYFPTRYYFKRPDCCEPFYYEGNELNNFLSDVSELLGETVTTYDIAEDAIDSYSADREWEDYAEVRQYILVN